MRARRFISALRRALSRVERFYWGSGIADDAPALTYYLVISLVPFTLGLAALAAIVFGDKLSAVQITDSVSRVLPSQVRQDVVDLVLATRRDSPMLLALALGAMLWTSAGAIGIIERCLSRILARPRHHMVIGKLRNLALGAMVAVLIVTSVAASAFAGGAMSLLPFEVRVPALAVTAGHLIGLTVLCALIYRFAVRGALRWQAALFGALPAAVAVQATPALVGVYFANVASLSAGRLFFSLAVLLLGCHLMAQALLIGAGLASRRQSRLERGGVK